VLGIALGLDDGKPVYTLEVLQGEKVTKTRIDAVGGKVLKSEEMKLDKEESDELAESTAALGTVKIPFARALELATKQNQQALADALRIRIALYESGKPFRQTGGRPARD
jgi:uncharacterized membrane protein YkoI